MQKRDRLTITLRKDLVRQVDAMVRSDQARNRSNAIERVLAEKLGDVLARRAIILGGGTGVDIDGVRTSPFLLRVDGVTLIERQIIHLRDAGIEEIFLAVGDFGDAVRAVVGNGARLGVSVVYFERDHGTASVLRQARSILKETFLMINGNIVIDDVDLEDIIATHKARRAMCTIALTTIAEPGDYGQVKMRGTEVVQYAEKPGAEHTISHIINTGIYVLEPAVCALVRPEEESIEHNILPLLSERRMLSGYMLDTDWKRIK